MMETKECKSATRLYTDYAVIKYDCLTDGKCKVPKSHSKSLMVKGDFKQTCLGCRHSDADAQHGFIQEYTSMVHSIVYIMWTHNSFISRPKEIIHNPQCLIYSSNWNKIKHMSLRHISNCNTIHSILYVRKCEIFCSIICYQLILPERIYPDHKRVIRQFCPATYKRFITRIFLAFVFI